MSTTPRLSLPHLAPGQAQKELFHNESLEILDALVSAAVEQPPLAHPVAEPVVGACYIVGASPAGAWSGHANHIASFTQGGWRFIAPREGMNAYVLDSRVTASFRDGAWDLGTLAVTQVKVDGKKVLGARGSAIGIPTGGSTIDSQARATISQILVTMREHGLIDI